MNTWIATMIRLSILKRLLVSITKEMKEEESEKEFYLGSVYADEVMDENENAMRHLVFYRLARFIMN